MSLIAVLAYIDDLARSVLNVPREHGSDDCDQDRHEPEWLDWEEWSESREFGNPVG
jgi:hypothetical protein